MSKILVSLDVPILGEKFDMFVPDDVSISLLIGLMANGVYDACGGKYYISGNERLMRVYPEELLNPKYILRDYAIEDGAQLMMI